VAEILRMFETGLYPSAMKKDVSSRTLIRNKPFIF
jgi:hypothetical protein